MTLKCPIYTFILVPNENKQQNVSFSTIQGLLLFFTSKATDTYCEAVSTPSTTAFLIFSCLIPYSLCYIYQDCIVLSEEVLHFCIDLPFVVLVCSLLI